MKAKKTKKINFFSKEKESINRIALFFLLFFSVFYFFYTTKQIDILSSEITNECINTDSEIDFYRSLNPIRLNVIPSPTITARSALVVLSNEDESMFLFEKNADSRVPIASITKLMTALIVLEEYNEKEELIVSENAFWKDLSRPNNLYPGETYYVKDLLYSALIESSNTAAQTLAERRTLFDFDKSDVFFVEKMNAKAKEIGMTDTQFFNASGLDELNSSNYSTARDIVVLTNYLEKNPLIWEILTKENYDLKTTDGSFKYNMTNTNQLLNDDIDLIGGKTGTTTRAGMCLVVVQNKNSERLTTVILGSSDRFNEFKTVNEWLDSGFFWIKK